MTAKKEFLICHLIGKYQDISNGGGVSPTMLAHWLNLSRQGASYHLRRMVQDGVLRRVEIDYRSNISAFRYFLSEKSQDLYEEKRFVRDYHEFVYSSPQGQFLDRMFNNS